MSSIPATTQQISDTPVTSNESSNAQRKRPRDEKVINSSSPQIKTNGEQSEILNTKVKELENERIEKAPSPEPKSKKNKTSEKTNKSESISISTIDSFNDYTLKITQNYDKIFSGSFTNVEKNLRNLNQVLQYSPYVEDLTLHCGFDKESQLTGDEKQNLLQSFRTSPHIWQMPNLKKLHLISYILPVEWEKKAKKALQYPNLTHLHLTSCRIDDGMSTKELDHIFPCKLALSLPSLEFLFIDGGMINISSWREESSSAIFQGMQFDIKSLIMH